MADNHWELYSSKAGWEDVAARLDESLANALASMVADLNAGTSPERSASRAFHSVLSVMDSEANCRFGAADTEPREVLAIRINRRLRESGVYGVNVNRWGEA